MKMIYNIAVVGLGQVGIYLLNELNHKKKNIEIKTGTKINVVAISAKNKKRKENLKLIREFFTLSFDI
jgi:Homoserine dehydrogenase